MAWLKMDDKRAMHRKFRRKGFAIRGLDEAAMCYAAYEETDGFVSDEGFEDLAHHHGVTMRVAHKLAEELVEVKRWERDNERGGWWIHDFLEFNPSREELAAQREWDRRRKALYSDKTLVEAVKTRDGDRCRYCGVLVSWKDRRGDAGAQFDHVVPRGPATLENIVVACRRCNIGKNNRTPDEAGMPLLNPGSLGKNQNGTRSSLDCDLVSRPVPSRPLNKTLADPPESARTRPRDDLWDSLIEVCRIVPSQLTPKARGAANKARSELASVDATPDEIRRRADIWRRRWPDMTLTPSGLAKQWPMLNDEPSPIREPGQSFSPGSTSYENSYYGRQERARL